MKRYLLLSTLIHLSIVLSFYTEETVPDKIDIQIINVDKPKYIGRGSGSKAGGATSKAEEGLKPGKSEHDKANEELGKLNTLESKNFKYATYINRIQRDVSPQWVSSLRKNVPAKKLNKQYTTIMWTILDKHGKIVDVILVKSCGDEQIDSEAIKSMLGQTFPNPPKELIEGDGYGRLLWIYYIN